MLKRIFIISVLVILTVFLNDAFAGMGGGSMGNPPCGVGNFPPCPAAVPLDGGIFLLAGAGIAMGARKMMKKK